MAQCYCGEKDGTSIAGCWNGLLWGDRPLLRHPHWPFMHESGGRGFLKQLSTVRITHSQRDWRRHATFDTDKRALGNTSLCVPNVCPCKSCLSVHAVFILWAFSAKLLPLHFSTRSRSRWRQGTLQENQANPSHFCSTQLGMLLACQLHPVMSTWFGECIPQVNSLCLSCNWWEENYVKCLEMLQLVTDD